MRHIEAQLIHDMRNTATVIRGAAETLHASHQTLPPTAVDQITGMLARRTDMLVRLLEDLATVHALDRGDLTIQLQRVDLAEECRDVVSELRDRTGHAIDVDIAPDAIVLGDPVRIAQILDNLLTNAARYGGTAVSLHAWRDGDVVRIEVNDDGPGVPAELVGSLFALYSRGLASRQLGGSGLGLAIVRQLCEILGGSIAYDNERGATFTATLPAVPVTSADLGQDAALQGHPVSFWVDDVGLADAVADYAAAGFVAGTAVVIAVTDEHRRMVEERLVGLGFDLAVAEGLGQYRVLDAAVLHEALTVADHIDPERFEAIVGGTLETVRNRWQGFRVFGEIVDLYWRNGDLHLALELESCWNQLRARSKFPLYCGYEISPDLDRVCDCHDAVLVA